MPRAGGGGGGGHFRRDIGIFSHLLAIDQREILLSRKMYRYFHNDATVILRPYFMAMAHILEKMYLYS